MSSDRFEGMPEADEVLQLQLEHIVDQLQMATQAEISITICVKGPAIQAAVKMTGEDEAHARVDSLRAMMCVASGSLSEQTQGQFKLMIQGPDGQLSDALPEGAKCKTGSRT